MLGIGIAEVLVLFFLALFVYGLVMAIDAIRRPSDQYRWGAKPLWVTTLVLLNPLVAKFLGATPWLASLVLLPCVAVAYHFLNRRVRSEPIDPGPSPSTDASVDWPALIKSHGEDELIVVSSQEEWDVDVDLSMARYEEADYLVDSQGAVYALPYSEHALAMTQVTAIEPTDRCLSEVDVKQLVLGHLLFTKQSTVPYTLAVGELAGVDCMRQSIEYLGSLED